VQKKADREIESVEEQRHKKEMLLQKMKELDSPPGQNGGFSR